ncbi:MAG: serine/threonine protein kinase [Kiritimatiellae bacterium]|nr:serine/threonine protein kinase [Kiritimatiellia bacterium]
MAGEAPAVPAMDGYDSFSLIGRGGMASVWRARQMSLDRPVAVKILDAEQSASDEDIDRFQSEARAAARMSHPGLVQVYDAFYRGGRFCLVMELVEGSTLGAQIRRRGRLSQDEALRVAADVAAALGYAWDRLRLVHCDIKPENVLLGADGSAKVTDFGLSRSLSSLAARRSPDGEAYVFGTPAYMPPEQCTGEPELKPQADMYSLGATLYHAVTGRRLFEGTDPDDVMREQVEERVEDPVRLAPELSPFFLDFLERLLAKNPADRFPTWAAVVDSVSELREGRPATLPPLDPATQPSTLGRDPRREKERTARLKAARRGGGRSATRRARKIVVKAGAVAAAAAPAPGWRDALLAGLRRLPRRFVETPVPAGLLGSALLLLAAASLAARDRAAARADCARRIAALETACEAAPPATSAALAAALGDLDLFRVSPLAAAEPELARRADALRDSLGAEAKARARRTVEDLGAAVAPLAAAGRAKAAARYLRAYDGPWAAETLALRQDRARHLPR